MKRRNADCSKLRRPPKRTKITDGIYGSIGENGNLEVLGQLIFLSQKQVLCAFIYLKLFMIWAFVLMADFIVDFRFEYLWPLWLLTQSLYDSFKYQGLAFSIFFVCVTITSDVACYLFIPVQWLFFTASTYVWVQYVWQTERGICLPTVLLWVLFLYIEVAVRLKEFKNFPFHLDLCRPFAAHCVGYPVITMGFSFKSCISYRFRLIKQKDVQKDNQFYLELLQQALPGDISANDKLKALPSRSLDDSSGDSGVTSASTASVPTTTQTPTLHPTSSSRSYLSLIKMLLSCLWQSDLSATGSSSALSIKDSSRPSRVGSGDAGDDIDFMEQYDDDEGGGADDYDDDDDSEYNNDTSRSNGSVVKNNVKLANNHKDNSSSALTNAIVGAGGKKAKSTNVVTASCNSLPATTAAVSPSSGAVKETLIPRLEADIKRLKADLQCSRNMEQELKAQIGSLSVTDRATKNELYQLRQENDNLQAKLHKLVSGKQQDKQSLSLLEKRLQEEKKQRTAVELQVAAEKRRKSEESAAARAVTVATSSRSECTLDACKTRRWELENELKQTRRELKQRDEQLRQLERETQSMQQYRDSQTPETDVLMSALGAMQDKNSHLEKSLSAETRLKLDLFSALGDAKRQIEIQQALLIQKEVELADLKSKVAEVMAFMPSPPSSFSNSMAMRYSPSFASAAISQANNYSSSVVGVSHVGGMVNHIGGTGGGPPGLSGGQGMDTSNGGGDVLNKSSLNPSASDYTPKIIQ